MFRFTLKSVSVLVLALTAALALGGCKKAGDMPAAPAADTGAASSSSSSPSAMGSSGAVGSMPSGTAQPPASAASGSAY
ncbi:MAG: hypothetical protein ABI845_12140 [Polaromonas sp.]